MHLICRVLRLFVYPILKLLELCIRRWVKPTNQSLMLGTVADLTQGRSELVLENAFLRQQVIVLSRPRTDREFERLVVCLARENDWGVERIEGELRNWGTPSATGPWATSYSATTFRLRQPARRRRVGVI
jgi:hypothetical protein